MKKIHLILAVVLSIVFVNFNKISAAEEEFNNSEEDYYAKENAIYSIDDTIATNNYYIEEINRFINEYLRMNNIYSLSEMSPEQSDIYFQKIEQIKQRVFGVNRVHTTKSSTKAADYSEQLFIVTESSTDKLDIVHGHAGIGDKNYVIEALNPTAGVKRQNALQRIREHFHVKNGKLYDVRDSGKPSNANYRAAEWARWQVGKGYDFDRNDDSGYFCSELVNEAWGRGAGKYLVNIIYFVSPMDLTYSGLTYFVKNL